MRIAFTFPGQGSQRAGMASAWRGTPQHDTFRDVGHAAGLDLATMADDAAHCGSSTAVGQPAIFAASLAAFRSLTAAGVRPDVVAGHSLGELTAAVAAGSLSPNDGAHLVAERGRAMSVACACSPGTMAAVLRLDREIVDGIVDGIEGVAVANENAEGQAVISGTPEAVEQASELAREAGGRVRALDVEGAFHSPAMAPALVRVDHALRRLPVHDPEIEFVSGRTGDLLPSATAVSRSIVDGILAPVRWRAVQHRLLGLGVDVVVEVGPGGVLHGLARRAMPDVQTYSVQSPADVAEVASHLAARPVGATR